jgi:hypothetical protein
MEKTLLNLVPGSRKALAFVILSKSDTLSIPRPLLHKACLLVRWPVLPVLLSKTPSRDTQSYGVTGL